MGNEIEQAANSMQANGESELADLSRDRAAVYGLLARLFREEADAETLEKLATLPQSDDSDAMSEGMRLIGSYGKTSEDPEGDRLTELAVDFVRVFIGHGIDGHSAAYPYESVYASNKRLLMQQARKEVAAIYASCKVAAQPSWKEGEDHIASELEFMQILCLRGDGQQQNLAKQKEFLETHLLNWVPQMAADMKRFAKTDFYRGLACMLEGFLTLDKDFLDTACA